MKTWIKYWRNNSCELVALQTERERERLRGAWESEASHWCEYCEQHFITVACKIHLKLTDTIYIYNIFLNNINNILNN